MVDYTFESIEVDPGESRKVELDLYGKCAEFWLPNEPYSAGEFIRLSRPTGFSLECTTAGVSGAREPISPKVIGNTVVDGSVTWTVRAAGSNGLNPISSPSATSDPVGLTIADVSVNEVTKIFATYTPPSNSAGEKYDAVYTLILNGVTRVARQRVKVKKQ